MQLLNVRALLLPRVRILVCVTNSCDRAEWCTQNKCRTAAFLGNGGGALGEMVDLPIIVPSVHYGRVEDIHLILTHIVCYYFMES